MDFFQHQEKAKNRTFLLVFLYILGLLGLAGAVAVAALIFLPLAEIGPDPVTIFLCISGILALVIGGSLFKTASLSAGGGCSIAESLGGRPVCASTTNPGERQLYNVVEEMSLAAGVPIPALYIMDNEPSINAFAAGFSPNTAVIGVNRGTIDLLTRDELQGVIAHEYAHILNGDMRMNMRLIGILFGLQLLALVGYMALRSVRFMGSGRQNKGSAGVILALIAGGVALMIIGYIGVFFSAVIRAAISRQREYLADASAVQFTRNPAGIAGALKKIGSPSIGSNIVNPHAAEASHLFFGDVCGLFSLGGLLATHPDITTRIRRIDPSFDGRFLKLSEVKPVKHQVKNKTSHFKNLQPGIGLPNAGTPQSVIENTGGLNAVNMLTAGAVINAIPKPIMETASNPLTAQAVFFAMLLDSDETIQRRQLTRIQTAGSPFLQQETQRLHPQVRYLPECEKISLAQHVAASLREMTKLQYQRFSKVLDLLIDADQTMDLFEYTVKAVLHRDLDIHFGLAKQPRVRYSDISSVRRPAAAVLSYLAYSGHTDKQEAADAFAASMKELGLSEPMLGLNELSTRQFDQSLRTLAETSPALKKRVFTAFMSCVWYDGKLTPKEAGLIRAVAAMLAVPIPML